MKKFVLLALFLFATSWAEESNESSSLEKEDFEEIAEFAKNKLNTTIIYDLMKLVKKTQEKCPDIEEKLEHAGEEIGECIEKIELGSETFCSLLRKNGERCSKAGVEAIASCLPEESKELPAMLSKIIWVIIDQACNSTVEEILELFNPCVLNEEASKSPECTEVKDALASHKDQLPSKSFVCSMIPKVRSCSKKFESGCTNPITKNANLHFHDAVEEAIKEDCDALNRT
ncbi:uncharacterized protein [Leptinotarsa decemlineata]|uniref:uncharacterized protein n=1 Tax=Leptinotarsa decemlineata TaxID=7539 RepID=UPI003D309128